MDFVNINGADVTGLMGYHIGTHTVFTKPVRERIANHELELDNKQKRG